MNQPEITQPSTQLAALEKRVGRIMIRAHFGKSWTAMTSMEQVQVLAYCQREIGNPMSLRLSALRPNVTLEIIQGKVWAVCVDCDSQLAAYRFGKWAASMSSLLAILGDSGQCRVRCLGLNPLVWRDVLEKCAS